MIKEFRPSDRKHHKIRWYHYINPWWLFISNIDDGYYGIPEKKHNPEGKETLWLAITWWLRNPFHNCFWYVLGVAHLDHYVIGKYGSKMHNPEGGWLFNWVQPVGWKLKLPYLSYNGIIKMYVGWRPSGAFSLPRIQGNWRK